MRLLPTDLGLYVHIPFCEKKCAYCNFYSFPECFEKTEDYALKLKEEIFDRGASIQRPVVSLYIGGGTPTVMKAETLAEIIAAAEQAFDVQPDAEITIEANPADNLADAFKTLKEAGVNRVSLGVQTAVEKEAKALGRRHSFTDVIRTVEDIKSAGIDNFSVDLMLGIPYQTRESLDESINAVLGLAPNHISAYILSIEEGTPLYKSSLIDYLPSEDQTAELYEQLCKRLNAAGYEHYEISNFAKQGYRSRHNTRYWKCEEYLGIGPAAHSFFEGKRFFCPQSIDLFLSSPTYTYDGEGGDDAERLMLGLRLIDGVCLDDFSGDLIALKREAKQLEDAGFCKIKGNTLSLTEAGMLISNDIISRLMCTLEEN